MGLKTEILAAALKDFEARMGRGAWAFLKNGSGVDNLSRIEEGQITPQLKTWEKLHLAFPDIIPEPVADGVIFISPTIQAASVKNGSSVQVNGSAGCAVSANGFTDEEAEIINLLRMYGNRAVKNKIKKMLYDIKDASG